MKNKFILYAIAALLFFNVIFQIKHLSEIDDVGEEAEDSLREIDSGLSSLRRSQKALKSQVSSLQAENGRLRSELQQVTRRIQGVELRLAPPPKK